MDNSDIKARFGIVGSDPLLDSAITTAVQVAPIHLSVLIIGESGSGKEVFPQIIHAYSSRKHKSYVAVNCGAIPEGTIDSELFGHEKGAFTGALAERKGYFEEANGGTIFLDEIGELPLATQAKLLRVLEKGEYMRVGSSQVRKTDVRIVAATNVDLEKAIGAGRFREDLFYRLNGVMVRIPPLRKRKDDIPVLFHKFTNDFADKNNIPPVRLTAAAEAALKSYDWPGNVRQLKNVAEQTTVLATERTVDEAEMMRFIPQERQVVGSMLPQVDGAHNQSFNSDRELLYKVLFDMRNDMNDLKKLVMSLIRDGGVASQEDMQIIRRLYPSSSDGGSLPGDDGIETPTLEAEGFESGLKSAPLSNQVVNVETVSPVRAETEVQEQSFSLADNEREVIRRALEKNKNNRRKAARELQISERTLYRKIREYGLDDK